MSSMSEPLSILNENYAHLEGPGLLHKLIDWQRDASALEFLRANGRPKQYSYNELRRCVLSLASAVQDALRVEPTISKDYQRIVPVLAPQSPGLYISVLAILEADAAFCPINLDSPLDRIKFVVEDVSAGVVITTREHEHLMTWKGGPRVILVEEFPAVPQYHGSLKVIPPQLSRPRDLAYVMYTSGSSGTPKGVAVSHLAASQSLLAHDKHIPQFKRFLQFAAPSFDVSVFEIFFPLFRGVTLVGCSRVRMLNDLSGTINQLEIDGVELTPTVVSSLLQRRSNVPGLKVLLTIGEMLTKSVVGEFGESEEFDGVLYAMYGPTEAAIHCTVNPNMRSDAKCSNIGIPFDTVSAYIASSEGSVDQKGDISILSVGQIGELVLGGPQVAECYLNRAEQNKAAFVVVRGQRAYRTGDKARITSGGSIEILGRITSGQVKLRGQRVELGEIEEAVYKHSGVRIAVASVLKGILVVFILSQESQMAPEDVLKTCSSWLPLFMVPSEVIIHKAFPYMPSGKVDKRKLESDFEIQQKETESKPELWNSKTEEVIAKAVRDVLGTEIRSSTRLAGIGLDSLVGIRLSSTLRSSGYNVSVVEILRAENVPALACICDISLINQPSADVRLVESMNFKDLIQQWSKISEEHVDIDDIEYIMPCTPLQDAMIAETAIDIWAYKNRVMLQLSRTVDLDQAQKAMQILANQNPLLRTGFIPLETAHSNYSQIVRKNLLSCQIEVVKDFHDDIVSLQSLSLREPLRIQLGYNQQHLQVLLHLHHAIYDAWSLQLLLDDLEAILSEKRVPDRPSFRSVVEWHCRENSNDNIYLQKKYWKDHLSQLEVLHLPCYETTNNVERKLNITSLHTSIRTQDVADSAYALFVSPQSIFQAAFSFILSSYLGSQDVCFGTVFSGRTASIDGIENITGPCLATLPTRLDLETVSTLREMVERLNSINRKHLEYSSLPLRLIKQACEIEPGQLLFDSLIVWQQTLEDFEHARDQVTLIESTDFLEFNLTLEIIPKLGNIMLKANYQRTIFPPRQVDLLLRQLEQLVIMIVGSPETSLDHASQAFSNDLLSIENPTPQLDLDFNFRNLTSTVEHLALNFPERTAIKFATKIEADTAEIQRLSYGELNQKANQITHHLIGYGILPDGLVCVIMDKSFELYVSILAVIKCGAGYLPISHDTPRDRIRQILSQANVKLLLCHSCWGRNLKTITSASIIFVDQLDYSVLHSENPRHISTPENLAYCIFTSGSTGTPKGVLITRGNLMSNLEVLAGLYPRSRSDLQLEDVMLLQSCSPAFDVSVFEIFFTWHIGACLCSAVKDVLFRDIERAINILQITHLSLTPTVAALVNPRNVPGVKFLITAGEALTGKVFNSWANNGLWQGYGPSETTNICTVRPNVNIHYRMNNIGPPLSNTSVFVLNPADVFSILPRGGEGEFCFGGTQVGKGYLDPAQAIGKFIDHPQYGRLYRSGDYGRLLPDGSLSFSGRKDGQVKLRGQRIELGEINSLLLGSSDVQDCVTLIVEDERYADKRIVSFLTPQHTATLEFSDLEMETSQIELLFSSLYAALPAYMVPSALIPVSSMPWTPQGKIDSRRLVKHYRSLPITRLDKASPHRRTQTEPQWSKIEERIAQVLATAADVSLAEIGPETSFFNLGIDSLSAISFARALRGNLELDVQISDILKYSSVSRLAYQASNNRGARSGTPTVESREFSMISRFLSVTEDELGKHGRVIEHVMPCTPLQEAMLSADEISSYNSYKNQLVLEIKVSVEIFKSVWSQMVQRHEILRTCFVSTNHPRFAYAQVVLKEFIPSWDMNIQPGNNPDVSICSLNTTQLSTSRYQPPYSIEFRNLSGSRQIILSLHHAVYDAVAISILFEEIEILLHNGVLQPPVSFAPFIEYVSAFELEEADTYWDKLLNGFRPIEMIREAPDASKKPNLVTRMKSELNLSWIEAQVKIHNTSLLSVCQASWISLLSVYLREGDICIGNVVSGRTVPIDNIDRLVAPCFNTIPIRVRDLHNLSFMEIFRELQTQNINSIPFQLSPLRRIQSRLNTEGSKLFDTLLILQQPARPLNPSIWSLLEDEGAMDVPIVIELVPQQDNNALDFILHSHQEQLSAEDSSLLLDEFDLILKKSLANPRHMVSSAIPYNRSNALMRRTAMKRSGLAKSESEVFVTMDPIQTKIRGILASFTQVPWDKIHLQTSIYRLGLDSISAVQVAACMRKEGLQVIASDLLQHPNIERLAIYLAAKRDIVKKYDSYSFGSFHQKHYENVCRELKISSKNIVIRPCTPIQCGMLAQTISSDGLQYKNSLLLELGPIVSLSKMRDAWKSAMDQHEMLRTGFWETGDSKHPFAMITYGQDDCDLPWSTDLGSFCREKKQDADSLLRCPWRLDVSHTNAITRIKFTAHHAIYDAQSLDMILSDVANFHNSISPAASTNQISISPLLSAILDATDQNLDSKKEFWQEESKLTVTRFPDLTPLHEQSKEMVVEICSGLTVSQLEQLCSQRDVSVMAAGQAAWGRLLSAYIGDASITFGLTLSGQSIIGDLDQVAFPTIVTLPVGCHIMGTNSELLGRIIRYNSQLHKHQFTPLTSIQRWAGRPGEKLFDTLLAYQKLETNANMAQRPWKIVDEEARAEYGLSIELQPTKSGAFWYRLSFQTNIVPVEQANIMLRQFDALLLDTLQNPENQCFGLSSFNESLVSITPAAEPILSSPVDLLHRFVEMQAEAIPNQIALEFTQSYGPDFHEPLSWNFQQLNEEGNRIANLILSRGASVGDLIAISFDKCPEASFAILGILKAGCAFVAIDPNAPPDRIRFIMNDARVSVVLTAGYLTKRFKEMFGAVESIEVIDAERLGPALAKSSPILQRDICPEDICYCLYTSGTTGTPKGCEITHENVIQAMMSFTKLFDGHWTEKSKWLQFASFHFDVSVLEQFWPWSVGICVASAPRDLLFQDMPETIKRLGVTHIDLTPSLARLLHPDDVPSLTKGVFITGGEQLKQEILDTWGGYHCIYNGYGPTEATIGVTMYPRVPQNGKPSNIGSQFPNVGSYIFRPGTAQPVLRGAVGELCVSGKLVGKGYLNRPELTMERFPHLDEFDERVYRTGDLVRILHDGSFLFLGRADDQVKLRGQRLELGEINSVIKKQVKGLQDVVTLVVRHKNQQKEQLVTFFVPDPGCQKPIPDGDPVLRIRDACKRDLPSYMVPTYIIFLDRLPLSANNKVEFKQLAEKFSDINIGDLKSFDSVTKAHKKWTTQEKAVLDSLSEILKVDREELASGGSIFEYGIDSISMIAFTRSLQRAGYKNATPSVVMQNTLIERLVKAIASNLESNERSHHKAFIASQNIIAFAHRNILAIATELKISPSDIECLAPCTPAQEGMIYRLLSSPLNLYFTTFRFILNESVDETRLRTAFSIVANRLQILRTKLVLTNDGCAQAVLKELDIDWQSYHLWDSSGKALDTNIEDRFQKTAYIDKLATLANPWRVVITKSDYVRTMSLTIFHGLYDGTSFPMMLRLIYQQYHMASSIYWGPAFHSVLPYGPLASPDGAEPFWKHALNGWVHCPVPRLFKHVQKREIQSPSSLSSSGQLENLRQKLGVTYQSLIQAALCIVLREFLGPKITFGLVISGRIIDFDNAKNVVGPLLNTVPFYMCLKPNTTWKDLIFACHELNLRILPYQHTPLRDVQKWCSDGKPLFDVLFVFQQEDNDSFNIKGFWEALPTNSVADYPLAFEAQLLNDGTIALEIAGREDILNNNTTSYLRNRFEIALQAMRQLDQEALSTPGQSMQQSVKLDQENIRIGLYKDEEDISAFKWTREAEQIRKEIELLSGTTGIDERTSIFELGLDSIDMIKLVSRLKASGIRITVSSLLTSQTIEKMLHEISTTPHSSTEAGVVIYAYEQQLTSHLVSMKHISAESITVLPATPLQEGMIAEMIASKCTRYFNHEVFRILSNVHPKKLMEAWDVVISQNDILRTHFVEIDIVDFPISFAQVVNRRSKTYWTHVPDSVGLELDVMIAEAIRNSVERAKAGEILQLRHVNYGGDHYFVLSVSHALYDGSSLRALHEDVWKAYHGNVVTRPDIRPTLEHILNSSQPDEVNFWQASLNNSQKSKFPSKNIFNGNQSTVHRRERISSHTLEELKRFGKSLGISLQTIGQTVWAFLLATLLKRLDVVFGIVLSCRDNDDATELMFPLMNTVAVRSVIHGSIIEMLRHMQEHGNSIRRYQHFPLRKAQALAGIHNDHLFDSLFIYQGRIGSSIFEHNKLYESVSSVSELEFAVCIEMEAVKDSVIWRTACKDSVLSDKETELLLDKLEQILERMIRDSSKPTISVTSKGISICGMEPFHEEIMTHKEQDHPKVSSSPTIIWTDRERLLYQVLAEVARSPTEQINKAQNLFNLGLDSISAIKVSSILKRHGINLTVSDMIGNTIQGMIEVINKNSSGSIRLHDDIRPFLVSIMKHVDREKIIRSAGFDPLEVEDVLPAAAGQEYTIARSQLSGGTLFVSRFTYQLRKDFSPFAFENAWRVLVRAHPILRTTFFITGSAKPLAIQIVKREGSSIREAASSSSASKISLRTPLILSTEKCANDHLLHLDIHHALYDGVSLPLLLDNLEQLYVSPRDSLPMEMRFGQFVARSLYRDSDRAAGLFKFWTNYLRKSTMIKLNYDVHSECQKALEVFEPHNRVEMLTGSAQRGGVSVDAILLAAFSKVYYKLIKTQSREPRSEAESEYISHEVVFGIYLATRAPYGEDLSDLLAPTLNILPIRVNTSRNLIEIAKTLQSDLQQLGSDNIIGSSLSEIYEWTGVQVNCFVNILKDTSPDATLQPYRNFNPIHQEVPRWGRSEILERQGDHQLRVEAEKSFGEAHKAYLPSVDIEMRTTNDDQVTWLDVGVFAPCDYLNVNEARDMIEEIKLELRSLK